MRARRQLRLRRAPRVRPAAFRKAHAPRVLPIAARLEATIRAEFQLLVGRVLTGIVPILLARGARRDAVSLSELWQTLQTTQRPRTVLTKLFNQVNAETDRALAARLPGLPIAAVVRNGAQLEEQWIRKNTDLLVAGPRVQRAVEAVIAQPLDRGLSVREIQKQLEQKLGIEARRAELIARDQTLKLAGQLQQARQTGAGIRRYVWTTSEDERVRPDHAKLDGTIQSWDAPPVVDQRTGRRAHPGGDFQCLPGNSQIGFTGPVDRAFRRWYSGQLTSLVTDSGETLECTPNHPVLTSTGWQPAERVQVGDHVFQIGQDGSPFAEADVEHSKAEIADIFQALALTFKLRRQRGVATQFHGDGCVDEEIEIVDVEGELRPDIEAALAQNLAKLNLANPDASAASIGNADAVLYRLGLAAAGGIGGLRLCLANFFGRIAKSDDVRLRSPAWLHSLPFDEGFDSCAADPVSLRELLSRGACDIRLQAFVVREWLRVVRRASRQGARAAASSADHLAEVVLRAPKGEGDFVPGPALVAKRLRVVQKSVRVFSGHVYNLSTESNWYVAQTLCTHNCRCSPDPVLDDPTFAEAEPSAAPILSDEPSAEALGLGVEEAAGAELAPEEALGEEASAAPDPFAERLQALEEERQAFAATEAQREAARAAAEQARLEADRQAAAQAAQQRTLEQARLELQALLAQPSRAPAQAQTLLAQAAEATGGAAASAEILQAIATALPGKSLADLGAIPFTAAEIQSDTSLRFLRGDPFFAAAGDVADNFGSSKGGLPQITIESDGRVFLSNGRHRLTVARELGLSQIKARVRKLGPRGGVRWEYVGLVKI